MYLCFYADDDGDPTIEIHFSSKEIIHRCLQLQSCPAGLVAGNTADGSFANFVNWLDALARRQNNGCLTFDADNIKRDGLYSNLLQHECNNIIQTLSAAPIRAWEVEMTAAGLNCGRLSVHSGSGRGLSSVAQFRVGPFMG